MLVELGLVEQRYQAVLEVLNDGATVTDVARRYGVARQTVHGWLRKYAAEGLRRVGGSDVEAVVVSASDGAGGRGADRGAASASIRGGGRGRSCIGSSGRAWCRCRAARRSSGAWSVTGWSPRRRGGASGRTTSVGSGAGRWSCGRWTSSAASVWSMGARRRSCRASTTTRGSACRRSWWRGRRRGRCAMRLALAMARHGVPEAILTDNGKVFTARFGPGPGPVLFDRICRENGIKHLLTAPRSPTTTGKVERWHKTLRERVLDRQGVRARSTTPRPSSMAWVRDYNHERPHQSIGKVPPIERFRLADHRTGTGRASSRPNGRPSGRRGDDPAGGRAPARSASPPPATRRGDGWPARPSRWSATAGSCELHHRGVLIATHARRHPSTKEAGAASSEVVDSRRRRATVDRRVGDPQGRLARAASASPAPATGSAPSIERRQVQVAVVGDTVEISHRQRAHPLPPRPPRPHPRARRPRQPRRPTPPHQRRLRVRRVTSGTGVEVSCGYRGLTSNAPVVLALP